MTSLQDHEVPTGSTINPELPSWVCEVDASLGTRPSRASSLVSTRTKFSTTTFQEDAKSIDLSISGHYFRISRDGSKVTSVPPGESLPPYPFSLAHEFPPYSRSYHRYASSDPGSTSDFRSELLEDGVGNQAPVRDHSNLASLTAYMDPATLGPNEDGESSPVLRAGPSDRALSDNLSGLSGPADRVNTLTSMAVRIQRAWRNYVQYHGPSSKPGESTSSPIKPADDSPTSAANPVTAEAGPQHTPASSQLRRSNADPASVPKKSVSFLDKDLPIPDEAVNVRVGSPTFISASRRPGAKDVNRSSLAAMSLRPQNGTILTLGSGKVRSTNQRYKPVFTEADGRESTEQLSLEKWFIGEDSKRWRDTDEPGPSPNLSQPPHAMDSENDVSNHYTRMVRFIDRDHRRALHARDKEMAELRERLNEKDIVYRQELRARDFLIEDLRKRLEHMEETTEIEIERARNQVEDIWESRWKHRDFHLRERMQRMESEMQKTMETTVAEREAFWRSKYDALRRKLDISEAPPEE